MGRPKKESNQVAVTANTFLDSVCGKLPDSQEAKLRAFYDKFDAFILEFVESNLHRNTLRRNVYLRWRDELSEMKRVFDCSL